ncbi:MFS transporter [Piscirickettsia litoralis]|uniref:MFS transporter n=1 Tax=Piscirickettsia litoralis TaxID=1891921 RepID=UPI001F30D128|nr:MFS transporter [Piscirickettsia litoralis]
MVIFLAVFFMTVGEILIVTKSNVFIANHSPSSHRGRINGILPAIIWSGNYLSPIIMGSYIQQFGFQSLWYLMIVLVLLCALFLWLMSLYTLKSQRLVSSRLFDA